MLIKSVLFAAALGSLATCSPVKYRKKESDVIRPEPTPEPEPEGTTKKFVLNDATKKADLLFLVDVTGSMGSYITAVKESISKIVEDANKKEVSLRIGFIGYRDPFANFNRPGRGGEIVLRSLGSPSLVRSSGAKLPSKLPSPTFGRLIPRPQPKSEEPEILKFTTSIKDFKDFVGDVQATGGGDTPEDVFGGLQEVPKFKWSRDAGLKVLFHIADAPHHPRDPANRDLKKLLGDIKQLGVKYSFGTVEKRSTDAMIEEFSKVWGSEIEQFTVTESRRYGRGGPYSPLYSRRGPSFGGAPGAPGPAGMAAGGDESSADKIYKFLGSKIGAYASKKE